MSGRQRRNHPRRSYVEDRDLTCTRCGQPIPAGVAHFRDRTRAPAHRQCVRLRVRPATEQPRFIQDPAVGQQCEGCDFEIREGEPVVHVLTRPWHTECKRFAMNH